MISHAPLVYAEMDLYDLANALGLHAENKITLITRPNAVGRILYALLIPSLDSLLERKCRAESSLAASHLLVALTAYRNEHDTFPEKTDNLVPIYMKAIPKDPYDGKPFRYDSSKGIVYSVGKDLKDSGGSSTMTSGSESDPPARKRWNAEDIVFALASGRGGSR